jgi:hypothetical protein
MKLSPNASPWVRTMCAELAPDHIALLIVLHEKREKQNRSAYLIDKLRHLRDRGLLLYDQATLAKSNQIWLSDLGKELAKALTEEGHEAANDVKLGTKG